LGHQIEAAAAEVNRVDESSPLD